MSRDTITNRIDISLTFYFKGERYTPTASIALDGLIGNDDGLPSFHQILARRNDIDLLSYHYEIMLEEPVRITGAEGLVADYVTDGRLDEAGFLQAWREQGMSAQLQAIAKQYLAIDDLDQNPPLKQALTAAFRLGKGTK